MRKQRSSTFCCCPSTNHCSYERNRNFHLSDKLCRMDGQNYFTTQGQTGTMTSTFSHLPASISSIYQSLPDCDLRAPSIVNTTVVDNLLCYVRLDNAEWLNRLSATISRRPPVQFSSIGKPSFLVKLFSSLVFGGGRGRWELSSLFLSKIFFQLNSKFRLSLLLSLIAFYVLSVNMGPLSS